MSTYRATIRNGSQIVSRWIDTDRDQLISDMNRDMSSAAQYHKGGVAAFFSQSHKTGMFSIEAVNFHGVQVARGTIVRVAS